MKFIADVFLIFHLSIVIFITLGFFLIPIGYKFGWKWIKNKRGRKLHLGLIFLVFFESYFGITCPLTRIENFIRNEQNHESFISYWIFKLLYWNFSPSFFIGVYFLCLTWTFIMWKLFPPNKEN
ncbi:MAG: hypothetical protein CBD16_02970 [Betaproteobacteria bacterium TMED156]|nr:MAG: hypothetical protein CBD16_02970 [Betaproteobacteria bacterium TMED156]